MTFNKLLLATVLLSTASVSQGASQWCKTGVCHNEDIIMFQKAADEAACSDACFNARFKKHDCKYFSFSATEGKCFLFQECDVIGQIEGMGIKVPKDVFLTVGNLSSYETCKFTQYAEDVWYAPDKDLIKTKQSSEGWGGRSSRAMDGRQDSSWGHGSCTHTHRDWRNGKGAWWEVEFPEDVQIDKVRTTNRGDCCWHRLRTYNVLVDDEVCGSGSNVHRGGINDVDCNKKGKKLKIQLNNRDYLTLCEVQIMSSRLVNISDEPWFL